MQTSPIQNAGAQISAEQSNKVLRNTYALLALSFVVSAIGAFVSMAMHLPSIAGLGLTLVGFAMLFVVNKFADSAKGLPAMFVFALVMGAALGPMLNRYLALSNGAELVTQALVATAAIFAGLSLYATTTKKDFSFMGGFLLTGLILAIVAGIANIFFQIPALSIVISSVIVFLMSGFILYDTGRIVNGGETNYIRATLSMYLNLYNMFTSLLMLLGLSNDD